MISRSDFRTNFDGLNSVNGHKKSKDLKPLSPPLFFAIAAEKYRLELWRVRSQSTNEQGVGFKKNSFQIIQAVRELSLKLPV